MTVTNHWFRFSDISAIMTRHDSILRRQGEAAGIPRKYTFIKKSVSGYTEV
jgi:hypothetical protein